MKRKFNQSSYFDSEENANPMDGVSNMSDAMLVLAVGIMLALVINWKIDIKEAFSGQQQKEAIEEDRLQEFDQETAKQNNSISFEDIESKYIKTGTVYTDTFTGKTYVVVDE